MTQTQSKKIVVFSDGTGNSGRQMEGTNVWRVRQAIEQTPQKSTSETNSEHSEQVVIYEDGVGTESFRPLGILGLAFSFGVSNDLVNLYEQLMLVYQPNDKIFLFGFSRGAFTIRVLSYILYRCGLASPEDSAGNRRTPSEIRLIAEKAVDAYKMRHAGRDTEFRMEYGIQPNNQSPLWFDANEYSSLEASQADSKGRVNIEFIGVWDTVSAVGLPFHNMTQALFRFWRQITWFWPLRRSLFRLIRPTLLNFLRPPNRHWDRWEDDLHPYIRNAYQALSLDDERQSFRPILWLELRKCECKSKSCSKCTEAIGTRFRWSGIFKKNKKIRTTKKHGLNVEQVWFAGMHADVGGGYPQDHLAYVSLEWMMRHAHRSGLRFNQDLWDEFRQFSSPIARVHDSRAGLGLYYRYKPRDVEWFCRDSGLSEDWGQPPLIHESVFHRIKNSPQYYAPRAIPPANRYVEVCDPHENQNNTQFEPTPVKTFTSTDNKPAELHWLVSAKKSIADGALIRKEAKDAIDLYIVLRKSAARWVVYITVFALFVGLFREKIERQIFEWIPTFSLLETVYDKIPHAPGWPAGTGLPPIMWLPYLGLAVIFIAVGLSLLPPRKPNPIDQDVLKLRNKRASHQGKFQQLFDNVWPFVRFLLQLSLVICAAVVLRPLVRTIASGIAPAAIMHLTKGLLDSPVLFGFTCGLIYAVIWTHQHCALRIEQWASCSWNAIRFENANRPAKMIGRSFFERVFSEKYRWGRYAGNFFSHTLYPGFALTVLTLALLFLAWIPVADILVRMRVSDTPDLVSSVRNGDHSEGKIEFKFDAKSVAAPGINVIRGRSYQFDTKQLVEWQDDTVIASLDGIPWDTVDAKTLSRTKPADDQKKWLANIPMKCLSFLCRNPEERYFQLCISIGSPTGTAYPVTPGVPFVAQDDGELFVFVNDVPGFYSNNSGTTNLVLHRNTAKTETDQPQQTP